MKKIKRRPTVQIEKASNFEEEIEIYEFYECLSEDELCFELLRETMNLRRGLFNRWANCIELYESKSFDQTRLHYTNLKYEI